MRAIERRTTPDATPRFLRVVTERQVREGLRPTFARVGVAVALDRP